MILKQPTTSISQIDLSSFLIKMSKSELRCGRYNSFCVRKLSLTLLKVEWKGALTESRYLVKKISVIPGSMWFLIVSLIFNHGLGHAQGSCPKLDCCQLLKPLVAHHIYSQHHTTGTNSCQCILDNEARLGLNVEKLGPFCSSSAHPIFLNTAFQP